MAAASAVEKQRAADQERAANELAEINERLARIEALLNQLTQPVAASKGRTAP